MVERLCLQPVVALQPVSGVLRVAEESLRLAERFRIELDEAVAELDVCLGMREFTVRSSAQIVNRAVLVKEPRDLVRMPSEIAGELRADGEIDPLAVRF